LIIHYSLLLIDDYAKFYIQNLIYFKFKGLFPIEVFYPGAADIIYNQEDESIIWRTSMIIYQKYLCQDGGEDDDAIIGRRDIHKIKKGLIFF
jgi:hypothetical protein